MVTDNHESHSADTIPGQKTQTDGQVERIERRNHVLNPVPFFSLFGRAQESYQTKEGKGKECQQIVTHLRLKQFLIFH